MTAAFRGNKKKKKGDAYAYPYTKEDMKRVQWCIDHGVEIATTPDISNGTSAWKVEIRLNKGDYKRDPKVYDYDGAMKKLYEYYKYYYDKYRN